KGVALGYSSAMTLVLIPIAAWAKLGTGITWMDLWRATRAPFLSGLLAGAAGLLVKLTVVGRLPLIPHLLVARGDLLWAYACLLLLALNQKHLYMDLLSHLLTRLRPDQNP